MGKRIINKIAIETKIKELFEVFYASLIRRWKSFTNEKTTI